MLCPGPDDGNQGLVRLEVMRVSTEGNKRVAERMFEEIMNQGNFAVAGELVSKDFLLHNAPPGLPPGIQGFLAMMTMYRTAIPDIHITVEDVIGDGDRAAVRWTGTGTHGGDFMGIPPTGRALNAKGIAWFRIEDGRIVEEWNELDLFWLLRQMGAIPG